MVDQAGETVQGPVPATASAGLPAFKDCLAAVSGGPASGIDAIAEPPAQLLKDCAEMSGILASSAVRTSLDAFRRRDAEAVRQQTNLMQEATRANLCLMVAGIASGLVLALAAQASGGQSAILPSGAWSPRMLKTPSVTMIARAHVMAADLRCCSSSSMSRWR